MNELPKQKYFSIYTDLLVPKSVAFAVTLKPQIHILLTSYLQNLGPTLVTMVTAMPSSMTTTTLTSTTSSSSNSQSGERIKCQVIILMVDSLSAHKVYSPSLLFVERWLHY